MSQGYTSNSPRGECVRACSSWGCTTALNALLVAALGEGEGAVAEKVQR